jgi:hypothetical protein
MNKLWSFCLVQTLVVAFAAFAGGQQSAPKPKPSAAPRPAATEPERPLVLTESIPLPGVKGRFDHFATGGGKLFVSALGNNSVEVIGTGGRTLDYTITGVPGPQGEAFSPEANKLFSASGTGKVYIYDGKTYDLITTVDFPGGDDNLRYEAANKRVCVCCGNNEKNNSIAMIDAMTKTLIAVSAIAVA